MVTSFLMSAEGSSLMPSSWSASILRKPPYLLLQQLWFPPAGAAAGGCQPGAPHLSLWYQTLAPKWCPKGNLPTNCSGRVDAHMCGVGQPLRSVRLLDGPSAKAQICRLQICPRAPRIIHSGARCPRGGGRVGVGSGTMSWYRRQCFFPSSCRMKTSTSS